MRRYEKAFRTVSYTQFQTRIRSVASAWHNEDRYRVKPDEFVCIMGFTGIDFATLDTACLFAQAVAVPIQAAYGFETLCGMLEKVEPKVMATTVVDLEMAVRLTLVTPSGGKLDCLRLRAR